jgi:hypothetical protein
VGVGESGHHEVVLGAEEADALIASAIAGSSPSCGRRISVSHMAGDRVESSAGGS